MVEAAQREEEITKGYTDDVDPKSNNYYDPNRVATKSSSLDEPQVFTPNPPGSQAQDFTKDKFGRRYRVPIVDRISSYCIITTLTSLIIPTLTLIYYYGGL